MSWEEVSASSGLVCRGGSCGFIIPGTKRKEHKQHALQGLLPKEPEFPAFPWGVCAQPDPQPHALLPAHPSPSHPHYQTETTSQILKTATFTCRQPLPTPCRVCARGDITGPAAAPCPYTDADCTPAAFFVLREKRFCPQKEKKKMKY